MHERTSALRYTYTASLTYFYYCEPVLNPRSLFIYSGVPRIFFVGRGGGVSTNSVEERGQREWGSGNGRGTTQFANERNPYSD
jgi:hypothetical protein